MSSLHNYFRNGLVFRKSSFSNDQQACVEVATAPDGARWVRDSKDPMRPAHRFDAQAWHHFLLAIRNGEFE